MVHSYDAKRYDTGDAVRLSIADGRISDIAPLAGADDDLPWVAPGFFDIQINGYRGIDFGSAELTRERFAEAVSGLWRYGVTRICPTIITNRFDAIAAAVTAIRAAVAQHDWLAAMVAGIHLEGPYISAEDGPRGAHNARFVRPADWNEFQRLQELASGLIRLVTLAPEVPGGIDFIRQAASSGVKVAIGHTAAEPNLIGEAVRAGATLSTHLGNGAHAMLRRHPNHLWEQMAQDQLFASIICDGHHLPPSVVKCIVRSKTPQRTILVSDAVCLAGLPPGVYQLAGVAVELRADGRTVVADHPQLLAGASLMIDRCIVNVQRFAGVTLRQAIDMATVHPAAFFASAPPRIAVGERADLVFLTKTPVQGEEGLDPAGDLSVQQTLLAGEVRWPR